MTMTLSGDGTITGLVAGGLPNATVTADDLAAGAALNSVSDGVFFRNRIINGDMRIAQRGTGAVTTNGAFPVDRFLVSNNTDGAYSGQQDASAPTGFINSVKYTVTTEDSSIGATQWTAFRQKIEGTNVSDLAWGTASAKTVTLSFWVRSSLTGTFGGVITNSGQSRCYPFTYTISVADTWEYKTVTIAGDTTGTWLTTTSVGIELFWDLGVGSTYRGTPGSWSGTLYLGATGATDVISTLNATWYITGVQLEVGSVATPFERRPYGAELQLCERYYQKTVGFNTATGTGANQSGAAVMFKTEMRSSPTPSLTAPLQITRVGVADFTQSSADVAIAGSGTRVNTLAISLNFSNFTSLPTDTCLPVIVTGGILTLSAEL